MNKKGFAISGIIYSILILFLILVFSVLAILGSRKLIIDKFKSDTLDKIYGNELEKEETIYRDSSGANSPELLNNMIPIKYDGNNWVYADVKKEWYDYDAKEWANAVVLNDGVTKNVGDTITEDEIALWYVWIPRYTYTIFNGNNGSVDPLEIQIKFESGTNSSGTVECVDAVSGSGTSSETCTDSTNGSIVNGTSTYTHPAFTFGEQELTGFWVGKFEVSTTDTTCNSSPSIANCNKSSHALKIKPNTNSLRYTNVFNFYTAIQNMSTTYSINGDSHMIKNMEWGAVAYLSYSKYGTCTDEKCVEVLINSNSSFYTGGGTSNAYKTNVAQSTTGNIYGVYDMSGGSLEYVMGNAVNSSQEFYVSNSGFIEAPNSKYYDSYTNSDSWLTHSRTKLGDAIKETLKYYGNVTGGWHGDFVPFLHYEYPWLIRGGHYNSGDLAGLFACDRHTGIMYETVSSTRAVMTEY